MAYFAQAGSGSTFSHSGSPDAGGAQQRGSSQHRIEPQTPADRPADRSQFPSEGPDLYSNYVSEPEYQASAPRSAPSEGPKLRVTQVQPSAPRAKAEPVIHPRVEPQVAFHAKPVTQHPAQPQAQPQVQAPAQPFGAAPAEQPVPPVPPHSGFSAHPEAAAIPPVAQPQAEPQAAVYTGAGAFGAPGEPYEDYGYDDTMEMPQAYAPPVGNAWSLTKTASVLGAVGSLALVIGIGVWGYQLVMRDVSGLPVVRSVEGPMRVQPENPGGSQADHQGLAVNSVAATGAAEAPADRLTLAPQPIELTPDDQPLSRLQTPSQDLPPTVVSGEQTRQQADSSPVSEASMESFQNGDIDALVAELTDGVVPMGEIQPVAVSAPTALNSTTSTVSPAIVQPEPLQPVAAVADRPSAEALALIKAPGVKLSLRPNLRPARFSPASAAPAQLTGRATEELDPNSLPAGTRLAQLGAYESAEVARAEWDRIYASFGDYLEGKKRVIQRAESGGRTFYRLRAVGFEGLSDARRFCSALVARNADCIPVTTR